MPIYLAYADDHALVRQTISNFLQSSGEFKILYEDCNGRELLNQLSSTAILPDICILDHKMPVLNGLETLRILKSKYPEVKVILLSMYLDHFTLVTAYRLGANGAVSKDSDVSDLLTCIEEVKTTGFYVSSYFSKSVQSAIRNSNERLPTLSQGELGYLDLLCEGFKNQEIADRLGVALKTVEYYRNCLLSKLNLKNTTDLMLFALRNGMSMQCK